MSRGLAGCVGAENGPVDTAADPAAAEPYLSDRGSTNSFKPVKVPAGEIYVMEDNRGSGNDSAQHGPLPADSVTGVVKVG